MDDIVKYRQEIDNIDRDIIKLIEERISLSKEIGQVKRENSIAIQDDERETSIREELKQKTRLLKKSDVDEICTILFKISKNNQVVETLYLEHN
jgi:chorismate mutase